MSHRTVEISTFEEYLEYLISANCSLEQRSAEEQVRKERLSRFPHSVVLKVSYPELDFANRWCWQKFGPSNGECVQYQSEYRVCETLNPHSHVGKWTSCWFAKTDYNFGFNEWYFAESADRDLFAGNVVNLNWGKNYPK